jgi:hypothetical protein
MWSIKTLTKLMCDKVKKLVVIFIIINKSYKIFGITRRSINKIKQNYNIIHNWCIVCPPGTFSASFKVRRNFHKDNENRVDFSKLWNMRIPLNSVSGMRQEQALVLTKALFTHTGFKLIDTGMRWNVLAFHTAVILKRLPTVLAKPSCEVFSYHFQTASA